MVNTSVGGMTPALTPNCIFPPANPAQVDAVALDTAGYEVEPDKSGLLIEYIPSYVSP